MTNGNFIGLAAIACLLAGARLASQSLPPFGTTDLQSSDRLKAHFKKPPTEFGTVPFWVWNYKVTKADIDHDLIEYKEKGFGGVFIHPRYGLVTEYLSAEWFDLVQYAVEKGKSLGLYVWLYDENSYPSGFAGGHVPAQLPESYKDGVGLSLRKAETLPPDSAAKYAVILRKENGRFIAVAYPDGRSGEYWLFEKYLFGTSKWYGGFSYVDLIRPGVTEAFIRLTMAGYEKTVGSQFGKTVPGIFTDEPHITAGDRRRSVKWTPDLFDQFEKRWGYDLTVNLPSLFEDVGDWKRVRHDYYSLLLDLFIDRWSKPWNAYGRSKNLLWTGHYWEHEWPSPYHGPDNMAMYAWSPLPGIDMLFNTFAEDVAAQFGNVRSVKELRSAANQAGAVRTLSETYGGAGWELRFEDMKRLGDWEYVLGVNLMNQHLSFMSAVGDRKHDYPQSFSYHEPWWHLYKPLADYYTRLSMAMSSGRQVNRILVVEPTTTAWIHWAARGENPRAIACGRAFQDFCNQLERHQVEYDLGSERILREMGQNQGSRLVVGKCSYETVVLPPGLENLEGHTLRLLETFLKDGRKIVSFAEGVSTVEGQATAKAAQLASSYPHRWTAAKSVGEAAGLLVPPDFTVENPTAIRGKLFHHRRRLADGQLVFLTNSSLEEPATGSFRVDGKSVTAFDLLSGTVRPYPASVEDGRLRVDFNLPPANSLLLFVGRTGNVQPPPPPSKNPVPVSGAGPTRIARLKPNTLTLDYCDLTLAGKTEKGLYFYTASDKIFKFHGFPDNPWASSIQYKTTILDRDRFAAGSGFDARFPFTVESGVNTESLELAVERSSLWRVSVNGKSLEPEPGRWWLDRDCAVFKIGSYVTTGENDVLISAHPMSIHAELEPVYVLGDFHLASAAKGWKLVPAKRLGPGEWRMQGLPFYADGVSYKRKFDLAKRGRYSVALGRWYGTVAQVRVNGKEAGIIGWKPCELDISDRVADGPNEIEVVVYGSLKNLLGPHHNVQRRGIVSPWSFRSAPAIQPPGEKYDNDGYGLFEDFQVLKTE